jgi:hypothetical protein
MTGSGNRRSYEESCRLLDGIVGRCVRDASFASRVLGDPESALREYDLNEDELEDFVVLQAHHREEAGAIWAAIREGMESACLAK